MCTRPTATTIATVAVLSTLLLAGCSGGDSEPVKVIVTVTATPTEDTTAPATTDEVDDSFEEATETTEDSEDSGIPATANIGETVDVGDWDVKITDLVLNANDLVHSANPYNSKPKGQYVVLTYEAVYRGSLRTSDAYVDLTWQFTTPDNRLIDEDDEILPADNQNWSTEARQGGTVRYQIVFDVTPSQIHGGTISVEGYDEDYNEMYADFLVE